MIASDLLIFRRCCALRLEGESQVGIIPICVSSEGRMMPYCRSKSKSLRWKSPACIKERLSTSAHTSQQSPTRYVGHHKLVICLVPLSAVIYFAQALA